MTNKRSNVTAQQARSALAMAYSYPIIGATLAIILGLMLNDIIGSEYQAWVWVIVQSILGTSLVLATRAASTADNFNKASTKKIGTTIGARAASFVLSIIWSSVMAFMSIGLITEAVAKMKVWSQPTDLESKDPDWIQVSTISPLTAERFLSDFLPSILVLIIAIMGTLLWLLGRAKED